MQSHVASAVLIMPTVKLGIESYSDVIQCCDSQIFKYIIFFYDLIKENQQYNANQKKSCYVAG